MNVLITGGAGFIGSNFVRYLSQKYPGYAITVLDKLTYAGHIENLKGLDDIKFIKGDIVDPEVVSMAMRGIDVVVHFAAESHVDRGIMYPGEFLRTNVLGTQVLLQAATKENIKLFHHVSTDEVFGTLPLNRPDLKFDESTPYKPHSPYSASKAASDHLVRSWHDTYGLSVTISNTSNNYGPNHDPEKLIPRFITNLMMGLRVPLMGEGENVRDWCYVGDHCRAIDMIIHAALDNPKLIGETFCVGGNSERTNKEVTMAILKLLGKDETSIERVPHRLGHDARYAIDSSKIERLLGWKPLHSFEESLAETVRWYQKNEWWWRPLKEGRPDIDPEIQQTLLSKMSKR